MAGHGLSFRILLSFLPICTMGESPATVESATVNFDELTPEDEDEKQFLRLLIRVLDENGQAVEGAQVTLVHPGTLSESKAKTDLIGQCEFINLASASYQLQVEKKGFYVARRDPVSVPETEAVEVTLNHYREVSDSVDVVYSPSSIDPSQTFSSESLDAREIVNLPYPTTRDVRNALPFLAGVVKDNNGQIHVNGSATYQTRDQLDGFNVTHPAGGTQRLRFSPDAVRSIQVVDSRYSAEYGKASGGIVNFTTATGDDQYRFSATNFIPSFQDRKGVHINAWTPRMNFSGPLRKGTAWFFLGLQGEYNLGVVRELPQGQDRNRAWRWNNLAKVQINLTPSNILTAGFLGNRFESDHLGLSRFDPLETTRQRRDQAYMVTLRDQIYLSGALLEIGFAVNEFTTNEQPIGDSPYQIKPDGRGGNFFKQTEEGAQRLQWISNFTWPTHHWHGRHQFKIGTNLDRIGFQKSEHRRPILVFREDGTLSRETTFAGGSDIDRNNWEVGLFGQDRWSLSDRWLLELGLRFDWDKTIRQPLISPRLASSYLLTDNESSQVTGGIGIFYDAANLSILSRPAAGRRIDQVYAEDGTSPVGPPIETRLLANQETLRAPRFLNWSLGLEQRLPAGIYLHGEYQQKRGRDGLAFIQQSRQPTSQPRTLGLRNVRKDRYHAIQITLRHAFENRSSFITSYTRSSSRSSHVFEFDIDNIIVGSQAEGPQPWDTPNRVIAWGWLTLPKDLQLACSLEWRDGFPFSLVNEDQALVGLPNSQRFPDYFSLNIHVEHRIRLLGRHWALRVGFNDVTGRENPTVVDNNVDSPNFMTFGAAQGRALVARLRLIGRT